jgi:nitrate/TMAO reductase-like tetraheme cytochrome c subunit
LTEGRQRHRYHPGPRPWYRTTWFSALVVVCFIAVVAVIVVIPVWATDTPTYCASCKATKPAGASWERSTHSSVSCVSCHVPPGVVNNVKWRTREWLNVWADYLNVPEVPSRGQRPTNENCLQCHSLENIPSQNDKVRMPHEVHVDLRNLTCADCHNQVAHPKPGSSGTSVSMAVCSMCHNQDGAPADCSFCHITPPPTDVHPKDYLDTHGKQALADPESCLRCHHSKAEFCDPCHAKPTPDHFSGTWRYTHGKTATKDPLGCSGCHDKDTFCEQCHRVQHPDDWMQAHGAIAAKSGDACLVCHPRSMCDRCHAQRGVKLP